MWLKNFQPLSVSIPEAGDLTADLILSLSFLLLGQPFCKNGDETFEVFFLEFN